ncbi:hypothetical protein UFOVP715_17 [uncultured Caudovirales phage]|uniref:Uncharacterized protein n=1 Tax=uncultured Caudovirales phage TaxID=2100421 RepID=A0A6J5NR54_9CAUD|nr:hypothetical protein UFOVP715_17 [uncultured Caudovirales phage]
MPSFAGLIAGALGGAAKGYEEGAQMEMKKQGELDLKRQLMDAEAQKQLQIDAIKRERDIADEDRKMSPEYLAKVSAADLTKAQGALGNRKTLAPLAAETETTEYTAKKPLDETKAADAVAAKIRESTTLAGNKDFVNAETTLAEVKGAAGTKQAQIRADSIRDRGPGGGSSAVKVRSTYTDDQGQKIAVLSDGSTKVLGKAADYDKTLSNLITKMAKDDFKFAKLPEAEKRKKAEERLRGSIVVPSSGRDLSGLSAYERDAKAD